jgi:hypothetical protein
MTKLSSAWQLMTRSLGAYKANWRTLAGIVTVMAGPIAILQMTGSITAGDALDTYTMVGSIFMNVALVYAIGLLLNGKKIPSVRRLYYDGSAAVARFVVAGTLLVFMATPALGAVYILAAGTNPPQGTVIQFSDMALYVGLAIILLIPSVWLLTRYGLALYPIVQDGADPKPALSLVRNLSQGRFWPVLGRLSFVALLLAVVSVVAYLPSAALGLAGTNLQILDGIYTFLFTLLTLPLINLYMSNLYRELKQTAK